MIVQSIRLSRIHYPLPKGMDELKTYLIWRKDAASPNVEALAEIIENRPTAA